MKGLKYFIKASDLKENPVYYKIMGIMCEFSKSTPLTTKTVENNAIFKAPLGHVFFSQIRRKNL